MFVALDSTEEGLAASAKDAFGVDSSISFAHKKRMGKVEEGLESGQITSRRKTKSRRRSACSRRADHDAHVRLDIPHEPI